MAKVKNIETRIGKIEGFDVVIKFNGRDLNSNRTGMPIYPAYKAMAKNDMTVAGWKALRFTPTFAGYDVDILDGDGNVCRGNMKLGTVRDSYSD